MYSSPNWITVRKEFESRWTKVTGTYPYTYRNTRHQLRGASPVEVLQTGEGIQESRIFVEHYSILEDSSLEYWDNSLLRSEKYMSKQYY